MEIKVNNVYLGEFKVINNKKANENKFFDNIDQIYVVSLKHRKDRRDELLEEFKKIGLLDKIKFFIAEPYKEIYKSGSHFKLNVLFDVNKNFFSKNKISDKKQGPFGCFISHQQCFIDAKRNNFKTILILEDDCSFYDNKVDMLSKINIKNSNFDLCYFGHYTKNKSKILETDIKNLYEVTTEKSIGQAHSIIFKEKMINYMSEIKIPKEIYKKRWGIDTFYMSNICKREDMKTYLIYPNVTYQRLSYSDNDNMICERKHDLGDIKKSRVIKI